MPHRQVALDIETITLQVKSTIDAETERTPRAIADGGKDAETIIAEVTLEYCDSQGNPTGSEKVEARIMVSDDEWTLETANWDGLEYRIMEHVDKIVAAPIDPVGFGHGHPLPSSNPGYEPGDGRLDDGGQLDDETYVAAVVGDVIDETLGELISDAREDYQDEHGIESVANLDIDVPDVELKVREGSPLFPSSRTGQTMAQRDRLVVEPVEESDTYDRWHDAILETCNRYQVWTGTSSKGTDELLAPPNSEAGERITLSEYLDTWYTVDPREVADAAEVEPDPADKIDVDTDTESVADLETTESVTGRLEGSDATVTVDLDVTISVECGDFYDDGRLVRTIEATFEAGDGDIETSLRHMTDLKGEVASYKAHLGRRPDDPDYDRLPERVREEDSSTTLRIDGPDAEIIAALEDEFEDAINLKRQEIQDEHKMQVSVDSQWESGEGEGHAIHAKGTVKFADGRELPIHWRNAVDIGHQVFTGESGGTGSDLPKFDDEEVDAAVVLARDESPITQAMRM